MSPVGIRELSHHTSRYLARVKAGQSFEITERGRIIAVLTPAASEDKPRRPRRKVGGYMLAVRLGDAPAKEFLDEVAADAYELVDFDSGDVASAKGIIDRYDDLNIGITDASLVVIAARFETIRLLTFDHRHFRTVAPLWGAPAFTVLPADA